MTNLKKAVAAVLTAAGLATGGYLYTSKAPDHKIPKDKISAMVFPKGMKMLGDKDGILCHQLVGPDGQVFKAHRIEGHDVRRMTEEEIKALVIADTQADLEEEGIACSTGPAWFSEALADVKRCDSCGQDCWITSCPAHVAMPYCQLEGTNCVISFICCGGANNGCPASCGA